jgi:type IV secretion system protein VirB10
MARPLGGWKKVGIYGAIIATALGLLAWSQMSNKQEVVPPRAVAIANTSEKRDFAMSAPAAPATSMPKIPDGPDWSAYIPTGIVTGNTSPPVAFISPSSFSSPRSMVAQGAGTNGDPGTAAAKDKADPFTAAMTPSDVLPSKAWMDPHPLYMISAGRYIDCLMDTATDSQLMGLPACHLPNDVWNDSGTVVLLYAGTRVSGQIKQGLIRGQNRLFFVWSRAHDLVSGIKVSLNSPAADELGRGGMPGEINNHIIERFAPAFLFGLLNYGPQIASQALSNQNGNNNNYFQVLTPNQQVAAEALSDQMRIPPTLEAPQGAPMRIAVATDWDLSCCVKIQLVNGAPRRLIP